MSGKEKDYMSLSSPIYGISKAKSLYLMDILKSIKVLWNWNEKQQKASLSNIMLPGSKSYCIKKPKQKNIPGHLDFWKNISKNNLQSVPQAIKQY